MKMSTYNSFSTSLTKSLCLLISFSLVILTITIFVYSNINDLWFKTLARANTCNCKPCTTLLANSTTLSTPDFSLLVGIHTRPEFYERRHLVRNAYAVQSDLIKNAEVDVRFVLCNLLDDEQRVLVGMEIMLYNDIMIINCTEDIEKGKTYAYFSSLPKILANTHASDHAHMKRYDYVIKTDDDTYFRLDNLAEVLRHSPRDDLYLGFLTPCGYNTSWLFYMSGMGYLLSWDIVEWISTSEIPMNNKDGVEDVMTGIWMRDGNKGKNRVDMNYRMYDILDGPELCYKHEFVPDTIAVHKLKTKYKWATTLKYFNVTRGLKPSSLYSLS